MRNRKLAATLVVLLATPNAALAERSDHGTIGNPGPSMSTRPLQAAALREVTRLVDELGRAAQQRAPQRDSWIGRHPVLFSSLMGLGLGLGVSAATLPESGNPDVTKGQYVTVFGLLGAGAGAGVGALISHLAR
jgi:hypothetical protein